MKCHVCGKSPAEGVTIIRQNAKGVEGIWACEAHNNIVDDKLSEVVALVERFHSSVNKSDLH